MKVCVKCGKEANNDTEMFCTSCGGDLVEKSELNSSTVPQSSGVSKENSGNSNEVYFDQDDIAKNKVFAIFAYFGILFLIPLLAAKDSGYARFHANQGLVLFIVNMVISILTVFVSAIGILSIVTLVFMVMGIINAASGKAKKLPLIGGITLLK